MRGRREQLDDCYAEFCELQKELRNHRRTTPETRRKIGLKNVEWLKFASLEFDCIVQRLEILDSRKRNRKLGTKGGSEMPQFMTEERQRIKSIRELEEERRGQRRTNRKEENAEAENYGGGLGQEGLVQDSQGRAS